MNINELLKKENTTIKNYYTVKLDIYGIYDKNLTSLEGLPDDFNSDIYLHMNELKNLKGIPKYFNSNIYLYDNPIKSLCGLNDVLDPRKIYGLRWNFIISEYKRLGKHHLLV